jgi:hypothetical protein
MTPPVDGLNACISHLRPQEERTGFTAENRQYHPLPRCAEMLTRSGPLSLCAPEDETQPRM